MQASPFAPGTTADATTEWTRAAEDTLFPSGSNGATAVDTQRMRVLFDGPSSIDFAIEASVANDIPLVAAAISVICVVAVGAMFVRDRVFGRTSLALLGIVSVCLSIGAGFGICAAIGIPFTTITQVLPFILLGIGVDDMFVLVRVCPAGCCCFATFSCLQGLLVAVGGLALVAWHD